MHGANQTLELGCVVRSEGSRDVKFRMVTLGEGRLEGRWGLIKESLMVLAQTLDAPYLPLPRADAQRLSDAVSTALDG